MPKRKPVSFRLEEFYVHALRLLGARFDAAGRFGPRRKGQRTTASETNAVRALVDDAVAGLPRAERENLEKLRDAP